VDEGLGAWIALCFGVWVQNSVRLARRREKPEIRLESREIGCIQCRYINLKKEKEKKIKWLQWKFRKIRPTFLTMLP
jgi:hypothetical protein